MRSESERVTVDVGGQAMGAYLARPLPDDPRAFPSVLLFMEIFGINRHIRSVADRIAAEGYVVLVPDFFHRTGPGVELDYDAAGRERGRALAMQVTADEILADARAAIAYLHGRADARADATGAIGFCLGGHIAYLLATTGALKATASFYGGGIASYGLRTPTPTVDLTEGIKGKIVCFFGAKDDSIPESDIERIKQAFYQHGIRNEVFVYPNAGHGFFRDGSLSFNQGSADDAWKKVKKLFLDELHGS
jgi:carboxymethylenebutenolidase